MAAVVRLYLDEHLSPKIAIQLRRRGVEVITAGELGFLGDSDENHLRRATGMGYSVVTTDTDFLELAGTGIDHAGIIFGQQERLLIGDWVNALTLICEVLSTDDMQNHVEFIKG